MYCCPDQFFSFVYTTVPIVLADKYPAQAQDNSAKYFAIFGGIGILCNPIKGTYSIVHSSLEHVLVEEKKKSKHI